MPTPTYTPLANVTLASTAYLVTFSSISQSYRDLVLVVNCLADTAANLMVRFNTDSGNNYNQVNMQGNGSTSASNASSNVNLIYIGPTTNSTTTPSSHIVNIMDYSATNKHKTLLARGNEAGSLVQAMTGRWANTAAVTTLEVYGSGTNFRAGTTMTLYGIAS